MQLDAATMSVPTGRFIHEEWPYEPRFRRVNGWRMHYVDEGSGDPVVLLHGNPAWGFLYRKFVKPLTAGGRRVIVPDMIGFGLSEKPVREQAHSLDGHIANLTDLLRQLDIRDATMVCHIAHNARAASRRLKPIFNNTCVAASIKAKPCPATNAPAA